MNNLHTFNHNMVKTNDELVNFTEYSSEIIKSVFSKTNIFNVLNENSNKIGFIISTSLVEKYCNLKITGSVSLKTFGFKNKKDFTKNKGYFLTYNAFEKIIKEHSKEYQECIQQIGEQYGNYFKLFYQKHKVLQETSNNSDDSDTDNSDESDTDETDESDTDESDTDESDSDISEEEKLIISCPDNIKIYNQQLIKEKKNPSILEYVKALNDKFYNIDISFIDDLLKIVGINECIIPHMTLEKYGVLQIIDKERNIENTCKVKRLLEKQLKLPDNLYRITRVVHHLPSGKKYKNEYLLSPYAFKLCLMRSQNTMKYSNYFLLLENCVKYFNDFHMERNIKYRISLKKIIKKKNKTIEKKDDKIDDLKTLLLDMKKTKDRMETKIDKMKTKIDKTSKDLKFVI